MWLCWLSMTKREGEGRDGANDEPLPSRSLSLFLRRLSKPHLPFSVAPFSFSLLSLRLFFFPPPFSLIYPSESEYLSLIPFFLFISVFLSLPFCYLQYSMSHCGRRGGGGSCIFIQIILLQVIRGAIVSHPRSVNFNSHFSLHFARLK